MRILLVEDEKNLSAALCRLLQQERFVVDPVYNGPDGLDCALSGGYDAIILDVMLPGMDGFTVLERLRAGKVSTPVMMLTARGDNRDIMIGQRPCKPLRPCGPPPLERGGKEMGLPHASARQPLFLFPWA